LWGVRLFGRFLGLRSNVRCPTVGLLGSSTPETYAPFVTMIREGLSEAGYVDGKNPIIESRWAHGQYSRLPALVADLIRRQVAEIITTGGVPPVLAARQGLFYVASYRGVQLGTAQWRGPAANGQPGRRIAPAARRRPCQDSSAHRRLLTRGPPR
jgi:hypothetical protein